MTCCISRVNGASASASSQTLAQTLVFGNTTDARDIIITDGQAVTGVDVTSGDAGDVTISGGDTTDATGAVAGGDVSVLGGTTVSTNSGARGGNLLLIGGIPQASASDAPGGAVTLSGGSPLNDNGIGGDATVRSGDGGSGGGNAAAGTLFLLGGTGQNASSPGGTINITAGLSPDGSVAGAVVNITGGIGQGTTNGGAVNITGGAGTDDDGADVIITGGGMLGTTGGGDTGGGVTLRSGVGTSAVFDIGNILIECPDPGTPASDNVLGGSITVRASATGIRNADGGDVNLIAGDTFGFNARIGGSIRMTCGNDTNGSAASDGGLVVMTPGTSVSGEDGRVQILGTGTLEMIERAARTGDPLSGRGYWWTRDDDPNVPMFSNDAATDFRLLGVETVQTYTRTATVVETRTLDANASATLANLNAVVAQMLEDMAATGMIALA